MVRTLEGDQGGYDLCIVGGGPAGLAIASDLAYSGLTIAVLESGSDDRPLPGAAALREAESPALPIKPNSRERVLGGASHTWGGLSALLDPIDFETRPWTPGWPVSAAALSPYIARAERYRFPSEASFEVPPGRTKWEGLTGLAHKVFVAVRPRFDFARVARIFERAGVDLFLDATTVRLEAGAGGRVVTHAVAKTLDGREARISARAFVLAAGGIENPRLLLVSGLGNAHDQVGRYFMNHPKGRAGSLRLARPLPAGSLYLPQAGEGRIVTAGLRLAEEAQRTKGLLNSSVQFEPPTAGWGRVALALLRRAPRLARVPLFAPRTLVVRWFADMEPRAENRVTLSTRRDALGTPLPVVRYALGERDRTTLATLFVRVKSEVARLGIGELTGSADEVIAAVTDDASHHLGATRMGSDPAASVVDADCKVHGMENLYVAGGSAFPTGGNANPTLVIVALALRLAEHLARVLGARPALPVPAAPARGAAPLILIGAGRRVAEDVLPALESLADRFALRGIYAPHEATLFGARAAYAVAPLTALTAAHLADVRFAYLAVPPHSLAATLALLPAHLELIIETPVPAGRAVREALLRFARVHVAEDNAFVPWLPLVRGAGPVACITAEHALYRHHGIALVKALVGAPIWWGLFLGNRLSLRAGSARVSWREPRDYARGTFHINGAPVELIVRDNHCAGFRYNGKEAPLDEAEHALAGFMRPGDTVVSRMMALKRVGLRRLLARIARGEAPWPLAEGLNDARIDRIVHRYRAYLSFSSRGTLHADGH